MFVWLSASHSLLPAASFLTLASIKLPAIPSWPFFEFSEVELLKGQNLVCCQYGSNCFWSLCHRYCGLSVVATIWLTNAVAVWSIPMLFLLSVKLLDAFA